jgi:hypothetical protein
MIVLGLAAAVAGLVMALRAGWRLYKTGRQVQQTLEAEVEALMVRQEEMLERVSKIEQNQVLLAEKTERMKEATGRLGYVLGELSEAGSRLTRLP